MSKAKGVAMATEPTPQQVMIKMVAGLWLSRAIYIAAHLGLSDLIKDGPRTAAELALATDTHAPSLYRVLRGLASEGIFVEDENGRFHSTPLAATLQSDIPGSMRATAISELGGEHLDGWRNVMHSVKTGDIAFDNHFGKSVWEYYAENPEDSRIFNQSMTSISEWVNDAVTTAYDFSGFEKIVDIGGGHGSLLAAVLSVSPEAKGILFDRSDVVEGAGNVIEAKGVQDRCEAVAGDFFSSVPEGADAYMMKFIIHDWNDEQCVQILRNCRQAMNPGGKLLVIEMVIPTGNENHIGKLFDLNMLVMTGGRERTEEDFRTLYQKAGFRLTRVVRTESPFCIIEGEAS
jgi:ubiquinone/menaquinone biosynthesis C-methylase UbiE